MTEYILNLDTEIFLWLNSFHALYWDVFMKMSTSKIIWVPMYVALVIALWRTGGWRTMVVMVVGAVLAVTLADQVTASLLRPMFERLVSCRQHFRSCQSYVAILLSLEIHIVYNHVGVAQLLFEALFRCALSGRPYCRNISRLYMRRRSVPGGISRYELLERV